MITWRLNPLTSPRVPNLQWRHDHQEGQARGMVPVKFLLPVLTRNSFSGNTPISFIKYCSAQISPQIHDIDVSLCHFSYLSSPFRWSACLSSTEKAPKTQPVLSHLYLLNIYVLTQCWAVYSSYTHQTHIKYYLIHSLRCNDNMVTIIVVLANVSLSNRRREDGNFSSQKDQQDF